MDFNEKLGWKQVLILLIGTAFLLWLMSMLNRSKDVDAPSVPVIQEPSIGITTEAFKKRFNRISEEIDAPFHINQFTIEKGNVDSFNVSFDKNHVLFGTITKNGLIEGLTSISSGDGTIQSGYNMLKISHIIVRAVSPSLTKEEVNKLVLEMMEKNGKLPDATANTRRIGEVEYFTSLGQQTGYWFGVQIPKK